MDRSPHDGTKKPRARKRLCGAPAHVISVPLRATPAQMATVVTRLEASRRVYNACLGEAMSRCAAMHADPGFEEAKKLPKGPPRSKEAAARREAFVALAELHRFTRSDLQSYGSSLRHAFVREGVGAQEAQVLGARAFDATDRWSKRLAGKPRFKSVRRGLRSARTKDLCGDMAPILDKRGAPLGIRWAGLPLALAPLPGHPSSRAHRDARAERQRLEEAIASGALLQMQVVRTIIRGRPTLRAQFVVDGRAPVRHKVGDGRVSIDTGPSDIYVVTEDAAGEPVPGGCGRRKLAPGVVHPSAELRRLQRRLDRQHRAGSPSCFDDKGCHKKGGCDWKVRSKRAQATEQEIAELHRRIAACRTSEHGKLANDIVELGRDHRFERLNYLTWQKKFPRSVRDRAIGAFMEKLARKAENAGGSVYPYSPYTTALSQTCVCGKRERKPLSQRYHRCACGVEAQRDLFSSYLGLHVAPVETADGNLDLLDQEGAAAALAAFAPYLQEAGDSSWSMGAADKRRVRRRRPPGRRSLVRIRARHKRSTDAKETLGDNPDERRSMRPLPGKALVAA